MNFLSNWHPGWMVHVLVYLLQGINIYIYKYIGNVDLIFCCFHPADHPTADQMHTDDLLHVPESVVTQAINQSRWEEMLYRLRMLVLIKILFSLLGFFLYIHIIIYNVVHYHSCSVVLIKI